MTAPRPRHFVLAGSLVVAVWMILVTSQLAGQRNWHQGETWLK